MTNAWTYRRADRDGIVELASWHGAGSLGLKPHFHDESQIVLVLSGLTRHADGGSSARH